MNVLPASHYFEKLPPVEDGTLFYPMTSILDHSQNFSPVNTYCDYDNVTPLNHFSNHSEDPILSFTEFDSSDDPSVSETGSSPVITLSAERGASTTASLKMRRRAQNRASQRAFRERKENHLRSLKQQLDSLTDRYRSLLHSYTAQTDTLRQLRQRIHELNTQVKTTRSSRDDSSPSLDTSALSQGSFDTFDAFSYPSFLQEANGLDFHGESQSFPVTHLDSMLLPVLPELPEYEDLLNTT